MSGHASHKGSLAKSNVNTYNTDTSIDLEQQDPQPEEGYPYDRPEAEEQKNSAATERVSGSQTETSEKV